MIWDPEARCDPEEVWTDILQLRRLLIGEQGHFAPSRWPGYEKRFPEATRLFLADSLLLTGPDRTTRTQASGHKRARSESKDEPEERPRKRQRRDETKDVVTPAPDVTDAKASCKAIQGDPEVCQWHLEGEDADLLANGLSYGFRLSAAYYLKMESKLWQMGPSRRLPFRLDGDHVGLGEYLAPTNEDRVLLAKLRAATRELVGSLVMDSDGPAGVAGVLQQFLDDTAGLDLDLEPTTGSPQKLERLKVLRQDGMLDFSQATLETKGPTPTGSGSGNAIEDDSLS